MDEYQKLADEELIQKLRGGDERIMDYILEKYKPLVLRKANAMFLIGGDTDDLIQEGMIGLFKAIRDYRSDREASFSILRSCAITVKTPNTLYSFLLYPIVKIPMQKWSRKIWNSMQHSGSSTDFVTLHVAEIAKDDRLERTKINVNLGKTVRIMMWRWK